MFTASRVLIFTLVALLPCSAQLLPKDRGQVRRLSPYVSSPYTVVEQMLDAANLRPGETLYDLGCGDGRFLVTAIQKYRARKAVGIEISPTVAKIARDNLLQNNVQDQASVMEVDYMNVDLSPADVVTMFLNTDSNSELRPSLEKYLRPGARVVSLDFAVPGWKPNHVEKTDLYNRKHTIYVYQMPPLKK